MPGEPGKVRLFRLFHHVAGSVNGPPKQGVVVGIDGRQAPAGKHGGDGSLPGAGTACDLDSAHRCLSSASSDGGRKRVCDPARTHGRTFGTPGLSNGAPIRYSQPGLLPCCLCTNMWITCAQRRRACAYAVEMLGISLPGRNHDRAFTWESASRILCIQRKPELSTCQPAMDNKRAERLSQVYLVVIRRRNRENTEPRDGEPGHF